MELNVFNTKQSLRLKLNAIRLHFVCGNTCHIFEKIVIALTGGRQPVMKYQIVALCYYYPPFVRQPELQV